MYKQEPIVMEPTSLKPSRKLTEEFYRFLNSHSPKEVSRHLRVIFLDYMGLQVRVGFPLDFNNYLWELSDLFDLLASAADYLDENKPSLKDS